MGSIRSAVSLGKLAKIAAILLLAPAAADAASFVKVVRTGTRTNVSNSSITALVPSSGVAAGNSLIVTLHVGSLGGAVSCSDPSNGAYSTDVVSAVGGAGIAIASKHNVAALGFGAAITCTYPLFSGASSVSVYEFSGLEPVGTLDQTAQNGSPDAGSASSGLTAATAQASELVFGFFWLPNPAPTQTFTPATSGGSPVESPYVPPYAQLSGGGTQKPMYRFVNAIRQYEANGTVSGSGGWKAQVATYKLVPDLCTGVNCGDGNPCTADACDPATGLCSHAPESAGTVCGDLSSGVCDAPDLCDGAGVCQTNHVADGTECGAVNDDCENPDTCQNGICQDNGVKAAGTLCGDGPAGPCNGADTCNGSGSCQPNLAADGTPCGDSSSGACDNADTCDGAGACGSNHLAGGTPCDDAEACTTADSCDGLGLCAGTRDELCFACIGNTAPVVAATVVASPAEPMALGSGLASVSASFTDTPGQTRTCTIDWGDESAPDAGVLSEPTATDPGSCAGSHLYTAAGVYTVSVAVADPCGESAGAVYQYAVVYDPNGGFVTGGGWIHSPEGAYLANPTLTGKAHFGFVSGYSRGNSTAPSGRTDFHFSVANFDFSSTAYEWLVISGAKARFRGTGQVNGSGSYSFALTAWDGQAPGGGDGVDKYRIRIWDENQADAVVYDNQIGCPNQGDNADPCTALGGGAIVIHKK